MCSSFHQSDLTEAIFFSPNCRIDIVGTAKIIFLAKQNTVIKKLIASLAILFFTVACIAQQRISGIVTAQGGEPLSGVTITLKGTNTGTLTGADGSFSIIAKPDAVLLISFIGYNSKQLRPGNNVSVQIVLTPSFMNLDQVVVTGYTSQKIKEISGSVSVVKPQDLVAVPAGQVEQMLQGRVAGLTVINSAVPGASSQVYLHGIGNFGNVTPLYIIDGVEGSINNLNPYDIESLQVLKDAGAYSIYGVRGANGAIIITTKKGKSGKAKISYDFYVGRQQPLKKGLDVLNPQEVADLEWLRFKNSGIAPSSDLYGNGPTPVLPDYLFAGDDVGLFKGDPKADPSHYNIDSLNGKIYQIVPFNKTGTDWFHEMMKPVISQNHTLSVSGGSDKNHCLLSFSYLDQPATYLNTYLKRYTARANTEFEVIDAIRIGENLQLSYSQNPQVGDLTPALSPAPSLPVYDIMGNSSSYGPAAGALGLGYPYAPPGPAGNSVTEQQLWRDNKFNRWQAFGNAFAEVDFLKRFTFRTSFGGSFYEYYNQVFRYGSYEPPPPSAHGFSNSFNEESGYASSWTWTNTLNYSGTFLKDHHIKMLVGTEAKNNYNRTLGGTRYGYSFNDPNYRFLSTGSPAGQNNYSSAGASYLHSFLSQANYDYKEKYFVSGTLRRDGSSVFGPESRFGWFPSIGAAWRMTEENFMMDSKWLTELKLRGSWGKTGFDGNTPTVNQYTLFGSGPGFSYYDINGISYGNIQPGFAQVTQGNAHTSWQKDLVTNIGLDAVLWNGKLGVTADVYNKNSTGLLFPVVLPGLLGAASAPNVNIGDVKNTGIDLTLSSKGNFSKDWRWDVLITLSHYKNEIVKMNNVPFRDDHQVRWEVGYPMGSFFGYKVIGYFEDDADVAKSPRQVDAAPGRFKYLDANGDGKIDEADRIHFGNPNPKYTAGLNLGLTYKNFDFSTFFYACMGNDVYNSYKGSNNAYGAVNIKTALYDSWTPQNHHAKAPIQELDPYNFSTAGTWNSYPLEKGSYLRNRTMIIGYNFPGNWLRKISIERLRVYAQAANLFTITKYTGLDPELNNRLVGGGSSFGVDVFGTYPNNQKQYLFGLNVGF
jgi:TonB-linked SusC/RagA family outer membrane protein